MFEQDYIMRLIKEMVRTILKLLFNIDTDSPSTDLLKETEDKAMLEALMNMIDDGRIDAAENKIYEITEERDKKNLEIAILFYSYLNDKSDAFLEEHNFSREEVRQGLKDILYRYGIDSFAEMILL
ncbi:MAG: hypothetical protein HDQ99_04165 [Lachnospiraceae bacterium]|nr:hypothetical protein [Lachnospiraceae bacterium]